jgi:hypothetical protein
MLLARMLRSVSEIGTRFTHTSVPRTRVIGRVCLRSVGVMRKGLWSALLVAVVVVCGGKLTVPASAVLAGSSGQVRLVLPQQPLTTAESVPVTVVNDSASPVYRSLCFVLERKTPRGWRAITETHGVRVPCAMWVGVVQAARSRESEQLTLWDDLQPGSYRITLFYRPVSKHRRVIRRLTRRDRFVRLPITVGHAPVRPKPQLSDRRLLRIAQRAATNAGDSQPTLIQHAAGNHFEAVRISSGDLVFEWNWSYLIAERGRFRYTGVGPAGVTVTGSVITLVVDAANGQITDGGPSKRYPHLRRLGPVTTDLSQ